MTTIPDHKVLINCDMGEWDAPHLRYVDDQLMSLIDLTNIACGGHAGSPTLIKHTLTLAKKNYTLVGAHPGYEDRPHFGRQYISMNSEDLVDMLSRQIDLFLDSCALVGIEPHHIKPHGALYHACNHNSMEAATLIELMQDEYSYLKLIVAPNSLLLQLADEAEITVLRESFIDRRYQENLRLVPRSQSGASITDMDDAAAQYHQILASKIKTKSGRTRDLVSDTCCIHGDNPAAVNILKKLMNV